MTEKAQTGKTWDGKQELTKRTRDRRFRLKAKGISDKAIEKIRDSGHVSLRWLNEVLQESEEWHGGPVRPRRVWWKNLWLFQQESVKSLRHGSDFVQRCPESTLKEYLCVCVCLSLSVCMCESALDLRKGNDRSWGLKEKGTCVHLMFVMYQLCTSAGLDYTHT